MENLNGVSAQRFQGVLRRTVGELTKNDEPTCWFHHEVSATSLAEVAKKFSTGVVGKWTF